MVDCVYDQLALPEVETVAQCLSRLNRRLDSLYKLKGFEQTGVVQSSIKCCESRIKALSHALLMDVIEFVE